MGDGQEGKPAASGVSVDAIRASIEQLSAACDSLKVQREARATNLAPQRPGEGDLARLDSSIKKNGAFIKKLRQLGADNRQQLLTEAAKLNLTKYVSEAVAALADVPLKSSDIPAAVEMAAALHARYPDFAASFGPAIIKVALSSTKGAEDDRVAARRQRGALRLLPELLAAGILSDPSGFLTVIKSLVSALDFSKDREASLHNATLLGGVIKPTSIMLLAAPPENAAAASLPSELLTTEDLSSLPADVASAVGELQEKQKQLQEELDQRFQLGPDHKQLLMRMFERAFDVCSTALVESHKSLLTLDRDNAKAFATKGELPEGAAAEYEASRKAYEALHRATTTMAEALGKALPELADDAFTRIDESGGAGVAAGAAAGGGDAVEHIFEDPETRAFYEQLPDLWSLVPTVLLKDATKPRSDAAAATNDTAAAATAADTADTTGAASADQAVSSADTPAAAAADRAVAEGSTGEQAVTESMLEAESSTATTSAVGDETAAAATVPEHPSAVDTILGKLSSCVSRDLCDELAVNFCYSNSKGARKKLVRALVDVPRGNLQLLPYYARVAATLSQAYPEVGAGVLAAVESEFDALAAKKDLTRAGEEPRLRVARYLAELAKFRLAPPSTVLLRLKVLLDDFTGNAVDGAAALVESAGRFLLRLPESKVRMENLLGVMMRLRNARNLDSRQTNAIDSAYFACRPPDKATQRRRRPPVQEYIRHLIFSRLNDGSIVEVLKKLMKLPWSECEPYLLKCLMKVSRVRFQDIALIASLAGGLSQYHDSLGVGLVDLVLEDVRWGLDHPFAGNYQQRLAQVRLLGEAYNYMLLDSRAVFDVLYLLIGYGHDSEDTALKLDPPDDYFRIRLVIALLLTCGSYFNKGSAKRRLDRFFTFMQAYVLAKNPLPLDIDADLQDMYDQIRPSLVRFQSYDAAAAAVGDILAREAAASASGLEPIEEEDSDAESDDQEQEQPKVAEGDDVDLGGSSDDDGMADYIREEQEQIDDEFEREYKTLMQECQGRTVAPPAAAAATAPTAAPAAPSAAPPASSSGVIHHMQRPYHHLHHRRAEEEDEGSSVALKVLMKRSGKDERKEVQVSADEAIAVRLMAKQESEAAERSQIKALVLEANQRDQAEEAAAAAAARAAAMANRRGYRSGRSRGPGGGLYRYQTPAGSARAQQGPQLTLRGHVHQLTGERREQEYPG